MFDYDGDGWLDLYLVNGGSLPGFRGPRPKNRLYRNRRDGTFEDTTEKAGCPGTGYGIGCCAGDYDGDGDLDLYVTQFGANVLYRNNGNGTFSDATKVAGVAKSGFSSGAAFGDYDGDGRLDLYVAGYVRYDPLKSPGCTHRSGSEVLKLYCLPTVYPPASGTLYHNEGHGRFRDVTREAGVSLTSGRSLGCVWVDYNRDGRQDLYVANDMSENYLFQNLGKGKFKEVAALAGAALSASGKPQAGMGVAVGDPNADGKPDLLVTNFTGEYAALYENLDHGLFAEVSAQVGLLETTTAGTGFGVGFEDFDLDGLEDIFIANGHVTEDVERFYQGITLAQLNTVHRNNGDGTFSAVTSAGAATAEKKVHRGAAFGDFDNDGRVDVLVANWRDEPDLLRNVTERCGRSLSVTLKGKGENQFALGAVVEVVTGTRTQMRVVHSGGSYCSQSGLRLVFGLGASETADRVTVRWPDGGRTVQQRVPAGELKLVE